MRQTQKQKDRQRKKAQSGVRARLQKILDSPAPDYPTDRSKPPGHLPMSNLFGIGPELLHCVGLLFNRAARDVFIFRQIAECGKASGHG